MEEKLSKEEELFIKRFQEHIEADQEEVKHALNINSSKEFNTYTNRNYYKAFK